MKVRSSIASNAVIFGFAVAPLICQQIPLKPLRAPIPLSDALRSHGVSDLSENSLVTALSNRDPDVRSLAANKLAEDGSSDAKEQIEQALENEQNLQVRANIAVALVVLDDPKGVENLHAMCSDTSLPTIGLIVAIQALENTRSPVGVCLGQILSSLHREADPGNQAMLLSTLPLVAKEVPPDQVKEMLLLVESMLSDQKQPFIVRQVASQTLSQVGSKESAEVIRKAISEEKDPNLRSSLQTDLNSLERRP